MMWKRMRGWLVNFLFDERFSKDGYWSCSGHYKDDDHNCEKRGKNIRVAPTNPEMCLDCWQKYGDCDCESCADCSCCED